MASVFGLGNVVRTAVRCVGIFLSRLRVARHETSIWGECDLGDDGAVLHDPLRQTDAGMFRRNRRGDHFGLHEFKNALNLVGGDRPYRSRVDDGWIGGLVDAGVNAVWIER